MKTQLAVIVAMAENRVIGRDGTLPWHLSADLKRFRAITTGHWIVMGRKTYESIGRPLPNRTTVVISRQTDYAPPGVLVAGSLAAALEMAADQERVFVVGGEQIYRQALPLASTIYLTRVQATVAGDRFFPAWDSAAWRVVQQSDHSADEKNDYPSSFEVLERVCQPEEPDETSVVSNPFSHRS